MKKICILPIILVVFLHAPSTAQSAMDGWISGVFGGIERGSGVIGAQIGYFFPHVGIQLDVAHAFDVVDPGTLRATTVMGYAVLPLALNTTQTNYFYLAGGVGIVNLVGGPVSTAAFAYGGGGGFAMFLNPSLALLIDLRFIGFEKPSSLNVNSSVLGRAVVGLAYRF